MNTFIRRLLHLLSPPQQVVSGAPLMMWLMMFVLVGCAPTKYVLPQDTLTNHNSEYKSIKHDSVYVRDSVFVERWHKGDTVFQDKVIEHWRDRWHNSTDTVIHNDTTTVYKPVEVVKEVRHIPPFYKWCTLLFWLLVVGKIGDIAIKTTM